MKIKTPLILINYLQKLAKFCRISMNSWYGSMRKNALCKIISFFFPFKRCSSSVPPPLALTGPSTQSPLSQIIQLKALFVTNPPQLAGLSQTQQEQLTEVLNGSGP